MERETKRIEALRQYEILDTGAEEAFDNLAQLAAHICGTSSAQINFIDKDRQWTKANIGWGDTEMPREISFCTHTIQSTKQVMVVPDTSEDDFFKNNPLTEGNPPLRFYAGVSIKSLGGYPIGTLCVYDKDPKQLSEEQLAAIQILANEVETHLKLRLDQDRLKETLVQENQLNQKIINSIPTPFFMYNTEGKLVLWNEKIISSTGYSQQEIQQITALDLFEVHDQEKVRQKAKEVEEGQPAIFEVTLKSKDETASPFLLSFSKFVMNDQAFIIGTGQDITEQKENQHKLEDSLKEKEVLLTEIHHRVKNNLAVILGMMQLETMGSEQPSPDKKFLNTMLRIQSMSLVHEIMYDTESFSYVEFDNVIQSIFEKIRATYAPSKDLDFNIAVEEVTLNVNQAIPCGLIINELLTNACKHAYPGGQGVIKVIMTEQDEIVSLQIADEGVGISEKNYGEQEEIGLTLVHELANQLNAELEIDQQAGTSYKLQFAKNNTKGSSSSAELN